MSGSPQRKKLRADFIINEQQPNCSCTSGIRRLEDRMNEVLIEIRSLRADQLETENQLSVLVDAFEEQLAKTKSLMTKEINCDSITSKLPIRTDDALIEMDQKITVSNRDVYIKSMSSLLQPDGVQKNLKNVLSTSVILQYNVDGVQGKAPLKAHQNFFAVLLDAIQVDCGDGSAEVQLRKAIQLQKKRHFNNSCNANKKQGNN